MGRAKRLPLALAAAAALLLGAAPAYAHVDRASYWPDSDPEMVDGVPAGGAVPQPRDLFTALNETAVAQTHVVCQTGEAVPRYERPRILARIDQAVSRAEVDRLEKKLRSLRRKLKDGKANERKLKRKVKRIKRRLARARTAYEQALAAELQARGIALAEYRRLVAQDQAAFAAYQQQLAGDPSIQRLDAALSDAVANGYVLRPSEEPIPVSQTEANRLRDLNERLLAQCSFEEIQPAVNAADNNDRVVVMPGIYTEPTSRSVPSFPAPENNPCKDMYEQNDEGNTGALSYRYQFHCPNQQNLIAVMGRAPKKNADGSEFVPPPPEPDDPRRDGIPDAGECIRCNLQLEGSGVSPDDVVVDSGNVQSGNGAPMGSVKDIGIRADRADGFVLRNMTVRHSFEHDIYSPETDGMLLEQFKTYFNGHYGVLTFVAQHHLIQDCDAAGSGDAAIYPGSSAERGEQTDPNFEPDDPTVPHTEPTQPDGDDADSDPDPAHSTEIRRCDMHHSNTGYSGTAANSVWIHHNDFYDNAMGLVSDVFTASGHPGFPTDSSVIEDNEFYSNNFNPYLRECDYEANETPGPNGPNQTCSDVTPRIPAPVGTAIFLPGVNNFTIRDNHMWDNWRRGTMLFSVPDNFVCGPASEATDDPTAPHNEQHGCDETEVNTSHRNEQYRNVMGRSPDQAPDPTWPSSGRNAEDPNGVDFWWDQFPGNVRNCWYDNIGTEGNESSITTDPPHPAPNPPVPVFPGEIIPCSASVGTGNPENEAELINCLADYEEDTGTCDWFATPPEPQPTP